MYDCSLASVLTLPNAGERLMFVTLYSYRSLKMAANSNRTQQNQSSHESAAEDQGYEVEMSSGEPVDNKYMCPVCLCVMRDAMQTSCGHRFCKPCITRVAGDRPWGRCPVDKTALRRSDQLFNDVAMQREILSLKVKCRNSSDDCTWTGELRDSEKHLKECALEKVLCPAGCQEMLLRSQLTAHESECSHRLVVCGHCNTSIVFSKIHKHEVVDCPKFPVPCTLCGQTGIPRAEIAGHMDSANGSCPQANVLCKFRSVGCHFQDKRKDMGKHYDSNMESHLSLLMGRVMELTMTNDMLRDELCTAKSQLGEASLQLMEQSHTLRQVKDRTVCGRLLWKVDLNNMQPLPASLFSPPFYTACPGYQLRLRLDFRGVRDGDDTFSSVFVVLQKGEFDNHLMFPFNGRVRVTVMAQISNHDSSHQNISTVINCKDVPRNTSGNANARVNSRGCTRFIRQKDLMLPPYNKNKIFFFDVSMVSSGDNDGRENRIINTSTVSS